MSDLISRSELIKELNKYCGNQRYLVSENIREIINNQPNAYDLDKVVEELEENSSRYTKKYVTPYGNNGYRDTKAISIHKAIEIVKQGGVSDDVCEWKVKSNYYVTKCSHDTDVMYGLKQDFKYCPYCGKKVKVVE